MRPVTINPANVPAALVEIGRASQENDVVDIGQNFTVTGSARAFVLNTAAPTAANVAQVLAQLIEIMQKGGLNRTT